jgi:colanic acid/amylovoran biosynthesis glycosyltransferase
MKVAYVLKYFPKNSETFIHEEIYQLIQAGVEVRTFSLIKTEEKKLHDKIKYILKNCKLKNYVSSPLNVLNNILELKNEILHLPELTLRTDIKKLKRDLKDFNPDVIHSHFLWERSELVAEIAKKLKIPFTMTCHAKDIYIPNLRRINKVAKAAKKIITISDYNKRLLVDYKVDKNKIKVIHCGIDIDDFSLLPKNIKKECLNLLFVGRLVEKKGTIYLLEAIKILKGRGIKVKLSLVGDGPLEPQLRDFVKINKLNSEINFKGRLVDKEIKKEIENCDYFVLPCVKGKNGDMDGIPVVIMEAMARGKTVISTDITGIPEIIQDNKNGYISKQNDSKDLANKIQNAKILDPKKIRNKIILEFNSKNNVQELLKIWRIKN